ERQHLHRQLRRVRQRRPQQRAGRAADPVRQPVHQRPAARRLPLSEPATPPWYGGDMEEASGPLAAEREFFTALAEAGLEALDRVLADDFVLVDVMRGAEVTKAALLAALGSGQLRFQAIEPAEQRVRLYRATAVVTGRTRMSGRFGGAPFA